MKIKTIRVRKGSRPKRKSGGRRPRNTIDPIEDVASDTLAELTRGEFDGTVIYVHGIANKPVASVLKCQWDRALFGTGMGQRSRMVYWVNRDRYPDPYPARCSEPDFSEGFDSEHRGESLADDDQESRMKMAEKQIQQLIRPDRAKLVPAEKRQLKHQLQQLAQRIDARSQQELDSEAEQEIIPLPRWARDRLTRLFTRHLLSDVYDYFFDTDKQQEIDAIFRSRTSAGGPFVIIGHSLGSVIAYKNLCQLRRRDTMDVRLLLTLGSPLGLQEVQDNLKDSLGVDRLSKPNCVRAWINLADRLDPVAADPILADDIDSSIYDRRVRNLDRPRHPHSATGYLGLPACQNAVRRVVGAAFAQPISSFTIARDLTDRIEDSLNSSALSSGEQTRGETHEVLIELTENGEGLAKAKQQLIEEVRSTIGNFNYVEMRRFLAAELTSAQIEQLGPVLKHQRTGRIWSNSEKQSLSVPAETRDDPIQSAAAARVYGADGENIHWAVLDTGIESDHPHFQTHDNVQAMWDCTGRAPEISDDCIHTTDRHGHGTHVAAIIAGEVQSPMEIPAARDGVAPKAAIHSYKVLGANGRGRDSYIIRALDHIASVNESSSRNVIHGVNLSLGGPFDPETYGCGHSPICRELRRLWRQGVLVVVAAGNAGFAELQSSRGSVRANLDLSIGDPANLEEAIAVGSVHLSNPLTYGTSFFSSRGPTADGRQKPDLVAPGERVPSANYAFRSAQDYIQLSGTSMAAPHVSGLLAAFLSKRRELIGEPDRVKSILLENCTSLNRDPYVQGAGMPNLVRMLLST